MHFAYLLTFRAPPGVNVTDRDFATVERIVRQTPELQRAHLHKPAASKDYYIDDGPSPTLALQLDFLSIDALESAVASEGHLQALVTQPWEILDKCDVEQQAMAIRRFPVMDGQYRVAPGELPVSYLVHYPGEAEDFGVWINYYLTHHPQIMAKFAGIREIEIYTRVDWLDAMPYRRVHYMQRNKLIFDNEAALNAANFSDVRHEMRQDFEAFPPFTGGNLHYPMHTLVIEPNPEGMPPLE